MPFTGPNYYVDAIQTGVAVRRFQTEANFIAPFLAPRQNVQKPSGLYTVWTMDDFNRNEMEVRGPTALPKVGTFARATQRFDTDAQTLAYDLNDAAQAASDIDSNPNTMIPRALAYKALLSAEFRTAKAFFAPGAASPWYRTVTGGAADAISSGNATGVRRYVDDATNDPVAWFADERSQQGKRTGQKPNAAVFGDTFWQKLRNHPLIRATLTTGSFPVVRNQMASLTDIAGLLELQYVGVSSAILNTALPGLAATNSYIVPADGALLYYAPGAGSANADASLNIATDQPSAMARFVWTSMAPDGMQIRRYREENAGPGGSWRSVMDMYNGYGIVTADMGTLFRAMITP